MPLPLLGVGDLCLVLVPLCLLLELGLLLALVLVPVWVVGLGVLPLLSLLMRS